MLLIEYKLDCTLEWWIVDPHGLWSQLAEKVCLCFLQQWSNPSHTYYITALNTVLQFFASCLQIIFWALNSRGHLFCLFISKARSFHFGRIRCDSHPKQNLWLWCYWYRKLNHRAICSVKGPPLSHFFLKRIIEGPFILPNGRCSTRIMVHKGLV